MLVRPSVTLFNELLILNVFDMVSTLELSGNNKNIDQFMFFITWYVKIKKKAISSIHQNVLYSF